MSPRGMVVFVLGCPTSNRPWENTIFFANGPDLEWSPKEGRLSCAPLVPKEWGNPGVCFLLL